MKKTFFAVAVLSSGLAFGKGWSFNAGYAWRSQADTSFRGGVPAAAGAYADGTVSADGNWTGGTMDKLSAIAGGYDPSGTKGDGMDYALRVNRSESVAAGGGEEDSASGLSFSAGYDFSDVGPVSFGVNLRFAGYWGIENGVRGGYCNYNDYYRISTAMDEPESGLDVVDTTDPEKREYLAGGELGGMRTTLKSDLYQIGLGPKVTWHVLSCVDIYGGVEALCTFVNSELDAGGASTDEVNCLWGVGGHVGFTGWMTENIGFFGQVGYEWIDEDDVSVRGVRATTDYSSLVLSAGLQIRF